MVFNAYLFVIYNYTTVKKYDYFYFPVPIQSQAVGEIVTQSSSIDHIVPPLCLADSGTGASDFMLVGDSGEGECLSHHLRVRIICNSNIVYFKY